MDKTEEEFKNHIGLLLAGVMAALKMYNASPKSLDEAELILTALTTKCFEYGMYTAEKERKQMS